MLLRLLLVPVLLLLLNGCGTAIGLGVGAMMGGSDEPEPSGLRITPSTPGSQAGFEVALGVELGTTIQLELLDGKKERGKYIGIIEPTDTDPEYYIQLQGPGSGYVGTRLAPPTGHTKKRLISSVSAVPASSVERVVFPSSRGTWMAVGGGLGLLLDLLVIGAVSSPLG